MEEIAERLTKYIRSLAKNGRFTKRVILERDGECMVVTSHSRDGIGGLGYVQVVVGGFRLKMHRISYEVFIGDIPESALILHSCDNKGCINPDHLSSGDSGRNIHEAYVRGLRVNESKDFRGNRRKRREDAKTYS